MSRKLLAALSISIVLALTIGSCDNAEILTPDGEMRNLASALARPDTGIRDWNALSDEDLWARLAEVGYLAAVGVRSLGSASGMAGGTVVISPTDWAAAKADLARLPGFQRQYADTLIPWI